MKFYHFNLHIKRKIFTKRSGEEVQIKVSKNEEAVSPDPTTTILAFISILEILDSLVIDKKRENGVSSLVI